MAVSLVIDPAATRAARDQDGQACMHRILAGACFHLGDSSAALAELERARDLLAWLSLPAERAYLHSNFGSVLSLLGRPEEAMTHHRRALELYRAADLRIGDAYAMAGSWQSLGDSYQLLGEPGAAAACLERAMALFRSLGSRADEAGILAALGDIQSGAGEPVAARASFQQALVIFGELRLP